MRIVGLVAPFAGAVLLGISTQFGLETGFGGPIVWKTPWWRAINATGWVLLILGFGFQLADGYRTRRRHSNITQEDPAEEKPEDEGFLSKEVEAIQKEIHAKYAAWCGMIRRVNAFAHRVISRLSVHNRDGQQVLAACLLIKLLKDVQGAIILAERGLESEARTMLRVAVEALFVLVNVCTDEEFFRSFVYVAERDRLKLIRAIRANPSPVFEDVRPHVTPELVERLTRQIQEATVTMEAVEQLARRVGLSHFYDGAYRLLSQDVHSSARSLERYLLFGETGELTGLRYGPLTEDLNLVHGTAATVTIMALGAIDRLLVLNLGTELRRLDEEVRGLIENPPDQHDARPEDDRHG